MAESGDESAAHLGVCERARARSLVGSVRRGERPGGAAQEAAAAASWTGGRAPARALPHPRAAAEEGELLGVVAGARVLRGRRQGRGRGGAEEERWWRAEVLCWLSCAVPWACSLGLLLLRICGCYWVSTRE